jgi:outer membrane lipoprotein carrier protein
MIQRYMALLFTLAISIVHSFYLPQAQADALKPTPATEPSPAVSPSPSPQPFPSPSLVVLIPSPVPSKTVAPEAAPIAPPPPSKSPSALPKTLQEIEKKYATSPTISAHFSQTDDNKTLGRKKVSGGKIFVKRPGKIRWETETPDPNLLVSNGKIFWFYTPPFDEGESGQLIERKSSEVQSQLATALLSGDFSKVAGIKVQQKSPSIFQIKPKPGTAGTVIQAEITLDLTQNLIQKVSLQHRGGNLSEIALSKIELGHPLADELFVFKAPPNTDRVK